MDVASEIPLSFVALLGGAARSTPGRASDPYDWLCGRLRVALTGPVVGGWIPVGRVVSGLPRAAVAFLRGVEERLASISSSGRGRPRLATPEKTAAFLGVRHVVGDSFLDVVRRWVVEKVVEADALPRRKPAGGLRRWAIGILDGWLRRPRARMRPRQWSDTGRFGSRAELDEVAAEKRRDAARLPPMTVSFGEPEPEFHDWTDELDGPDPDDVIGICSR